MDKKLFLIIRDSTDSARADLIRRIASKEAEARGYQLVVLEHGKLPELVLELPACALVRDDIVEVDTVIPFQTKTLSFSRWDMFQLDKRVRNVLKFNRIFVRRRSERLRRRTSF